MTLTPHTPTSELGWTWGHDTGAAMQAVSVEAYKYDCCNFVFLQGYFDPRHQR
jgi:hypothetical protein